MTTPLLDTKLFAHPPSPQSMERQRLTQRLDAGLHGTLTLVCAPAGFGKSTLLSAWVHACEHPSAWLSLDDEERAGLPETEAPRRSAAVSVRRRPQAASACLSERADLDGENDVASWNDTASPHRTPPCIS